MPIGKSLDVFVSSTCYDLLDLRAELGRHLSQSGMLVRLSDRMSEFVVNPTTNSIDSCLANVDASDCVVCIIDRRYGRPLPSGTYAGKSPTHAEVEYARDKGKPIFFFMRNRAADEFGFIRDNGHTVTTRWVERHDRDQREKWFNFVTTVSKYTLHPGWSNWYDPFTDIIELKDIVSRRLVDHFPSARCGLALDPDRIVRMTFVWKGVSHERTIYGHFRNVGIGPALNIRIGFCNNPVWPDVESHLHGALAEGDRITMHDGQDLPFTTDNDEAVIFCEYENRFGDRYRIEQSFSRPTNKPRSPSGRERVYVYSSSAGGNWIEV